MQWNKMENPSTQIWKIPPVLGPVPHMWNPLRVVGAGAATKPVVSETNEKIRKRRGERGGREGDRVYRK